MWSSVGKSCTEVLEKSVVELKRSIAGCRSVVSIVEKCCIKS